MNYVLTGLAIILFGGLATLVTGRKDRGYLAVATMLAGSALGLIGCWQTLSAGSVESWRHGWSVPFGALYLEMDSLTAFFLVPVFLLGSASAVYGMESMSDWRGKKWIGASWFFFHMLAASLVVVLMSRNAVLFLVSWEIMAVTSFFLVTFDSERESVREGGWIYLVATHLGTAFIFVLFLLLGRETGSMDFDSWSKAAELPRTFAGGLFVLAIVGFGAKSGFMPFHVWVPEAYPAAPSHVAGFMSGAMINMGVYGILRMLTYLGAPPYWWGVALIVLGLLSAILGVLFAMAQHDMKRMLAYSSVENMGIVTTGMGLGLLGVSMHVPALAALGFGGGLLHVLNHSLFKGLLFLGAGSVLQAAGTCRLNLLGGLLKRLPSTGACFLVGAAAICALPPLNGMVGEFFLMLGAFKAATTQGMNTAIPALSAIGGLALVGGLVAVCFTQMFGMVFLGEPRSRLKPAPVELPWAMRLPMLFLAGCCVAAGLFSPWLVKLMAPVVMSLAGTQGMAPWAEAGHSLLYVVLAGAILLVSIGVLAWLRLRLLAGRIVGQAGTWDCGYAAPNARIQYTASAFAQPVVDLFRSLLWTRRHLKPPEGYFPVAGSFSTETPDLCQGSLYRPAFLRMTWGLSKLRWLQHGHVQLYVLYIAVTLLALLLWRLN
jgi:formate hydrogenlyase subunit 3/multisubunit Na+/H+ antiporter MnhD subunit